MIHADSEESYTCFQVERYQAVAHHEDLDNTPAQKATISGVFSVSCPAAKDLAVRLDKPRATPLCALSYNNFGVSAPNTAIKRGVQSFFGDRYHSYREDTTHDRRG
jgi:hypothetical protein